MSNSKRKKCENCQRPVKTCLCEHISKVYSNKHWLILRYTKEKDHALNTVNLLELGLDNLVVLDGEDFSKSKELQHFIDNDAALVWPSENAIILDQKNSELDKQSHFILIDGTWNKAKKIYHSTPSLKDLRHISFNTLKTSEYKIRKTNKEGGLSTLECVVELGKSLDSKVDYSPITRLFNAMIDKQIECMGEEVFKRNYLKD